ncbi:MAG: hypothetical protein JJU37_16545 [Balneolaceae bacterium]|nr:hypothetical protein [Balneolaceae bacterium]
MISTFTYHLPFVKPFKTGSSVFKVREGVIIRYAGDVDAIAEAAPLPGFSTESADDVRNFFSDYSIQFSDFFDKISSVHDITPFLNGLPSLPSAQFALSMLALSVLSQRENTSIESLLNMNSVPESISVNSVIGSSSVSETARLIQESVNDGFSVIKLKVTNSPHELASVLKEATRKFPDVRFRLDANQSWPAEKVAEYSALFKNFPIEYIEEPSRYSNEEELTYIIKSSALPVALDESIADWSRLESALKHQSKTVLIIKPTLFGNFLQLAETISQYRSSFDQIVVTTALESAVGRSMVKEAAFLIGDRTRAHGLHTGHLLTSDLLNVAKQINGIFSSAGRDFSQLRFDQINQTFLTS